MKYTRAIRRKRKALFQSIMSLILCFAMLTGTTFAWFSDSASSEGNIIQSGGLDVKLEYKKNFTDSWSDASNAVIFNYDQWEPGYSDVRYLQISNDGNLAFQYQITVEPVVTNPGTTGQEGTAGTQPNSGETASTQTDPGQNDPVTEAAENGGTTAPEGGNTPTGGMPAGTEGTSVNPMKLAEVIDVYFAPLTEEITSREMAVQKLTKVGTLADMIRNATPVSQGVILPKASFFAQETQVSPALIASTESTAGVIMLKMREEAGNEYMSLSAGEGFTVKILATQYAYEADNFGTDYDTGAVKEYFPDFVGTSGNSAAVNTSGGKTTEEVTIGDGEITALVPQGTQVKDGTRVLTLSVTEMNENQANIELGTNEVKKSFDVHIEGLAENNTTPIQVNLGKIMPTGQNEGNVTLYHVENGTPVPMKQVFSKEELLNHNDFYYDPATGDVTVVLATFSEVALVADKDATWEGKVAESFAGGEGTVDDPYIIANADQLAYLGKSVSDGNSYSEKTIKLLCDINMGGKEAVNPSTGKLQFYPIGCSSEGLKKPFSGTFDGNNHTIKNIFQNTWMLAGNYDGTYYNAAMGLFCWVYGGTVKNLIIDNFKSEGEYAVTGCVAAYAANATFENISITNSEPATYNNSVAAVVGRDGKNGCNNNENYNLIFRNITVDSSNTVHALWGSYDVGAAGLLGYLGPESKVLMDNCNISATLDVYNDVCGNYQYYWYRYCGMLIGTVDRRHDGGKGALDLTNVTATNCTVNFGDRHEYFYCEFEKNTQASYTDDYQFSRVDHKDLTFEDLNGNGSVDTNEVQSVIGCKNHGHSANEDKQAVYIPFYQVFGGYGWGVDGVDLEDLENINVSVDRIDVKDGEYEESVEKFAPAKNAKTEYETETTVSIGELFAAVENVKPEIKNENVQVTVSAVDEKTNVTGTFTANTTDWTKGTLTFSGIGDAEIIITDYYYCTPTTVTVSVKERENVEKFEVKLPHKENFTYRVGNGNAVALGSLFKAEENTKIGTVAVTFETISGSASGTHSANDVWTQGTIQFSGTGVVKVTITDDDYCTPTELELQVIDAVNATTATSATSNNVVLLTDCGFSSLEVSGGYTLYGNGFTLTCGSDSVAADFGYSFVDLDSGILDNVQIVCPNFDYAALYKTNLTSGDNRSDTDSSNKTRYYNARSGVMASGNSQILNSRISGGRAALNVTGGNVVVDNSRIELGAVASILVGSANSLTLRDVTLVQKPTASTYDPPKTLMGFSVLLVCDADGNAAPVTIEGNLIQNAWVDEKDKQYVPSAGESIISTVLGKKEYLHDLDGDGTKESLNLGFAYMPESLTSKVNTTTITDNRTNKNAVPYDYAEVSIANGKTYVYSYKNTNGTTEDFKEVSGYTPNKNSDIVEVAYSDTADGLEMAKSFETGGWVYELKVDLDKLSGYALDFSKLTMTVNGDTVANYKVNGSDKPTTPVAVTAGSVPYTLTATGEGKEHTANFKVTGTETSKESPSKISGPTTAGFGVAKSYGGDWSGAADVLTGVKIKYWSVAENEYVEFDFSNFEVPGNAGKLNGTNNYWEYTHTNNDFTLKVTNTVAIHSGKSVYGMPIRGTDGKLYFTISSTNGYVGSGTTSRAIEMQYEFTDNNGGEKLTFTHKFNISYNKDEQYSYSDLSGSGKLTKLKASSSGSTECVTPDTLITLANGQQVRVDSLTGAEELLVWNLETGKLDSAPIMFVDSDPMDEMEVIYLHFSDGTVVKVISEHGFWDNDLNRYVYLDRNAADYIGHTFAKQAGNDLNKVKLIKVELKNETTTAWSPVTAGHLCYFVNGMLSMPGGVGGLFNIFDVNPETMTYDYEAMAKDIETYGLFTYEEMNAIAPLSEDMFNAAGGAYLKVSMGKGNLTVEELVAMITRYSKYI